MTDEFQEFQEIFDKMEIANRAEYFRNYGRIRYFNLQLGLVEVSMSEYHEMIELPEPLELSYQEILTYLETKA